MIRFECAKCQAVYFEEYNPLKCKLCDHEKFYWDDEKLKTHRCNECCDCDDCEQKDKPCHNDCQPDEDQCYGCHIAEEERKEIQYEIDVAQGKY